MADLRLPDSEVVMTYWLRRASSGLEVSTNVPETLPTAGLVQVTTAFGTSDIYTGIRNPTMQLDCWVGTANKSSRTPWGAAAWLAERVIKLVNDTGPTGTVSVDGFVPFIVHQVYVTSEPRRVEDSRGYARYSLEVELYWSTAN